MGFLSGIGDAIGNFVSGDWGEAVGSLLGSGDDDEPSFDFDFGDITDAIGDAFGLISRNAPSLAQAAGAFGAYQGQQGANEMNLSISREQSAFNAAEAEKNRAFLSQAASTQMGFQKDMSNTAYQRGIEDMKQAGLNPMLAYSHGGASSPSGAMPGGSQASASPAHPMFNKAAAGLAGANSAAQVQQTIAETRLRNSQTRNVDADTLTKLEEPALRRAEVGYKDASASHTRQMEMQSTYEVARILSEINEINPARYRLMSAQQLLAEADRTLRSNQNITENQHRRLISAEAKLAELHQAEAGAFSEMYKTPFGTKIPYLREGEKFIGSAFGAARDAAIGSRLYRRRP